MDARDLKNDPEFCETDSAESKCGDLKAMYDDLLEELSTLMDDRSSLVTSTRHSCLTEFVAGVAHEINNPNGVVKASADAANRCLVRIDETLASAESIDDLRQNDKIRRYFKMLKDNIAVVEKASHRIDKIVRSLKSFSHLDGSECKLVDINEGLEAAVALVQHRVRGRIAFNKDLGKIPELQCYPTRLNQAFLSLMRNAVDAIEGSGEITARTSFDDGNIVVEISDTGRGIEQEDLRHLFRFGFRRGGTRVRVGTGLASAFSIVKDHGGEIDIESEPGKGTTVTMRLPIGHLNC